jgi:hypothetical protein
MAHATEEQQPPVQVVTHPAQDDENTRLGTETPSTITRNGGISRILLLVMGTPSK